MNSNASNELNTTYREVIAKYRGVPTSDGAGVKLTRIIGSSQINMLDPFLLLDCFESDEAEDYIGGFPEHPHRGFETVTYLLNGRMRHKDNAGHEGVIEPGGVQWMSAARGITHSEMPEQENGLLKGFQLWVNLPAKEKMNDPGYQEFSAEATPIEDFDDGSKIRVIAGETNRGTQGPVQNKSTEPVYMDISLSENADFHQTLPKEHNAFIYVIDGELEVDSDDSGSRVLVSEKTLAVLNHGDRLSLKASAKGARLLLISGKPIKEAVVRGGPFVMNSKAEVLQAFRDYDSGQF